MLNSFQHLSISLDILKQVQYDGLCLFRHPASRRHSAVNVSISATPHRYGGIELFDEAVQLADQRRIGL